MGTNANQTWGDVAAVHLAALRDAYTAEVERLAQQLRPRFASGELRANTSDEYEGAPDLDALPQGRLEAICAEHFGVGVTKIEHENGRVEYAGDERTAYLLLAVSPHTESTCGDVYHPGYHAQDAAAWDVIALARKRGWYTPAPTECGDPGGKRDEEVA